AVTVKKLTEGDEWLNELKWDGYRLVDQGRGRRSNPFPERQGLDRDVPRDCCRGAAPEDQADRVRRGDRSAGRGRAAVVPGLAASKFAAKAPDSILRIRPPLCRRAGHDGRASG